MKTAAATVVLTIAVAALPRAARAQASPPAPSSAATAPIEDNSFLIEEAYNQDPRVVQHISTFVRDARHDAWVYTFTQEWPVGGQRNQLSATIPLQHAGGGGSGVGDVLVNYRYQLLGGEGARTWVAPRLSLVLPTGNVHRGFGAGAAGVQLGLPLSVPIGDRVVTHWNAGATYTPRASDASGERATTLSLSAGQSVVWLVRPLLNVLVETVWTRTAVPVAPGVTTREDALLVSPGVRGAVNFANGLQIVPGLAVPIGVGPSHGERSVLAYLSFEHPF